jgi:hypothetical protein
MDVGPVRTSLNRSEPIIRVAGLLLLFCDSSGSKDTHCRHISKFAGEIITGAILTGAIITDTIDRNRHCITNTIDRNEYSHLILALRRTSGKNKRAGYMQGEFIYHNMSNSAVNANGILKDASERAHSVKYHDKYIQLMLKNPCSQQASGRRPTE